MKSTIAAPHIDVPAFDGPFDLLLHLIKREALDITAISLAQVTEQYLKQVQELRENRVDQLIDFLVIAARLMLIKSRALLPRPPSLPAGEEEEDPAAALVRQLQRYKSFKSAAVWLAGRQQQNMRTDLRIAAPPSPHPPGKLDLSEITPERIMLALQALLARGERMVDSVSVVEPPTVTIEGQLRLLRRRLVADRNVNFGDLLTEQAGREEVTVTLLATLELMKRQEITVRQLSPFGPIELLAVDVTAKRPPATEPTLARSMSTARGNL